MLRQQETLRRIPGFFRPLRPPNGNAKPSNVIGRSPLPPSTTRLFTQNSQFLLVSSPASRPQLPFLNPSSVNSIAPLPSTVTLQYRLARLISSERRRRWKLTLYGALRATAYLWTFAALVYAVVTGFSHEAAERAYPTPPDFSFWSRWTWRRAKVMEFGLDGEAPLMVNRSGTGKQYLDLIKRLEDPDIDGRGLLEVEEGGLLVPGIGKTGFDLQNKSEPWRRGYHEALMGAARAAEHLDGWLMDKERKISFPPDVVIGPSNPRPRPVPYGAASPPLEENCVPAFESPDVFYVKILTTSGFTTKQKLDAALAYADWLEFKGLKDTAGSMYDWALDIAVSALPVSADHVIDKKTGVFKEGAADVVSENLLRVTTALAVHKARAGDIKAALPIFLSVLRNRRELPPAPAGLRDLDSAEVKDESISFFGRVLNMASPPPYPPSPPSGDDRPYHSAKEACEEAGVMVNIGEILFATSSADKGLSWTRDAVDAAEAVIVVKGQQAKGVEKCKECLEVGLGNWKKMLQKIVEKTEQQALDKQSSWLKLGLGNKKADVKRWETEGQMLQQRIDRLKPYLSGPFGLDPLPTQNNAFLFA